MRRWPNIPAAILAFCGLLVVGGLGFVYSGIYDIAATEPHWPMTRWLLETARSSDRPMRPRALTAGIC